MTRTVLVGLTLAGGLGCGSGGPTASLEATSQVHAPERIPIEAVAELPVPGGSVPTAFAFTPDDRHLVYLRSPDASLVRMLWAFDITHGIEQKLSEAPGGGVTEENLSHEERLRRERQRELGLGLTSYRFARDTHRLIVPLRGDVFVQDGVGGSLRKLVDRSAGAAIDARITHDGRRVAFVRNEELHAIDVDSGEQRQLTTGAAHGVHHGLAEFIAQEEMGRHYGHAWSWDGAMLAYTEVDERHVPQYRIVHQASDSVGEDSYEDHRYPFSGAANAKLELGIVQAAGGPTRWLDIGNDPDIYVARFQWFPDGRLIAQLENRAQTRLELVAFDPRSGKRELLLVEDSNAWINLHDLLRPLEHGSGELAGAFVWASERSGFRHLYLYGQDGRLIRTLTDGPWMVDALEGIDENTGKLYFTATKDGPTERHLYETTLQGGEPRRLTLLPGTHNVTLDHGFARFVDVHSSVERPPRVTLRSLLDGRELAVVHEQSDARIAAFELRPPELVALTTQDGETLHGAIYRPDEHVRPPYPTIVSVYGGPHVQRVVNAWSMTADMRAQYLRGLGFLVFVLDNRGSARRGLAFERRIKYRLGDLEVRDQVEGVDWLVRQGLTDPARVGIQGWSYGGYVSAMALCRAPETFKVAIAGAPITYWEGYDTHYTERYMGTPAVNPTGYLESSVMRHVPQLSGRLMLVHGLLDENVHFRHTARLVSALIAAHKPYQLLMLPDERHFPRSKEDRVYLEERMREFWLAHL